MHTQSSDPNQKALDRYNLMWLRPETAPLYRKATQGHTPNYGVHLQDHVLRRLGYTRGYGLMSRMSKPARAFVDWMVNESVDPITAYRKTLEATVDKLFQQLKDRTVTQSQLRKVEARQEKTNLEIIRIWGYDIKDFSRLVNIVILNLLADLSK